MVIDDDEPTNFISTMLIEEAACTRHLEIADSGLKALTYLKKATDASNETDDIVLPELIFLDINMPRMNGWEFLTEFRKIKNGYNFQPVIIMLTTSLNPDDKHRAENTVEINGFENKPLTRELIDRVTKKYFTKL